MPAVRFERRFYIDGRHYGPGVAEVPADVIKSGRLPKSAKSLDKEAAAADAVEKKAAEEALKDKEVALSQIGKGAQKAKSFKAAMKSAAQK